LQNQVGVRANHVQRVELDAGQAVEHGHDAVLTGQRAWWPQPLLGQQEAPGFNVGEVEYSHSIAFSVPD